MKPIHRRVVDSVSNPLSDLLKTGLEAGIEDDLGTSILDIGTDTGIGPNTDRHP